MSIYHIQGSMRYNVTVSVEADSPEEAIEKAENDEWFGMVEEGRWKDAWDFTGIDPEGEYPPELQEK